MTPSYTHLLFTVVNGVATITLNRPEVFNAINELIAKELQDALKYCARTPEVRAIVLSGGEGKAFCSGQDLKEGASQQGRSLYDSIQRKYNPLIKAMRQLPKPIIGAINGAAAGAGCSIALACDYTIAAEEAYFSELFINIALVPDSGSSFFLPRLIGSARAFDLCTTGRRVYGPEAFQIGMINRVVPLVELTQTAQTVGAEYAARPTAAIGQIKRMLNQSFNSSLEDMLELEALYQESAGKSHDHKEGVISFLEKRKPEFKGM